MIGIQQANMYFLAMLLESDLLYQSMHNGDKFCTLNIFLQVEPALVADIKFIKPNHKKSSGVSVPAVRQPSADNTQITQRLASNADDLYQALHAVIPSACIFISVPISEQELENETTVTSTPSKVTVTSMPSEVAEDRETSKVNTDSVAIPAPLTVLHKDDELDTEMEKLFCSLFLRRKLKHL